MTGVIGINHSSAPVSIRERFTFDKEQILHFAGMLEAVPFIKEPVVLSTCNRTEVYYSIHRDCAEKAGNTVIRVLLEYKGIDDDVTGCFYSLSGLDAVKHLFRVAAGIDSMVLGENQILGQVKQAYRISSELKLTGPVINKLFHKAFEVGKRVRNETAINQGASSISYAAVELCEKIFEDISLHNVLLIGAGETGELVLKSLKDRGCTSVIVINRTAERAEKIAAQHGARSVPWEGLLVQLQECDIIISSTSSKEEIIGKSTMAGVMRKRKKRTIFFIDLAVPRDIDSSVRDFENVFLYNIDDLDQVVAHNYEKRKKEIFQAERIIHKTADDFESWLNTLNLGPTIELLAQKFQGINDNELKKLKNRLPDNEFKKIEEYGRFLQGKYLGLVIKNLKKLSLNGSKLEYLDLVNELFELREGRKE